MSLSEKMLQDQEIWEIDENTIRIIESIYKAESLKYSSIKNYTFDKIYKEDALTTIIYEDFVKKMPLSSINGINGCIFALGGNSGGKIFSLFGSETKRDNLKLPEIYNEKILDREDLIYEDD
jgi:hypothetical protein